MVCLCILLEERPQFFACLGRGLHEGRFVLIDGMLAHEVGFVGCDEAGKIGRYFVFGALQGAQHGPCHVQAAVKGFVYQQGDAQIHQLVGMKAVACAGVDGQFGELWGQVLYSNI
jgi:hypothetical protein